MSYIDRLITRSAREWSVPAGIARVVFWMPIVGAILFVPIRLDKDLYRFLLNEDGPVEWAQIAFFAAACVGAACLALRLRARHRYRDAVLYGLAACVLAFIVGEEMAWGQRILGFETPAELAAINKQNEVTVHNIGSTLVVMNLMMLVIGAWGMLADRLNRVLHVERLWQDGHLLLVPPFFLAGAFGVVFGYKLIRFTVWIPSGFTITKYGEWAELCLAFGLSAFVWLVFKRLALPVRQGVVADSVVHDASRHVAQR